MAAPPPTIESSCRGHQWLLTVNTRCVRERRWRLKSLRDATGMRGGEVYTQHTVRWMTHTPRLYVLRCWCVCMCDVNHLWFIYICWWANVYGYGILCYVWVYRNCIFRKVNAIRWYDDMLLRVIDGVNVLWRYMQADGIFESWPRHVVFCDPIDFD